MNERFYVKTDLRGRNVDPVGVWVDDLNPKEDKNTRHRILVARFSGMSHGHADAKKLCDMLNAAWTAFHNGDDTQTINYGEER